MERDNKFPELQKIVDEMATYEKRIFDFDNGKNNFTPTGYSDKASPKEDGTYLTIRCGLSGIYTVLNEWKDGNWQMQCLDGSTTIAFLPKKIELESIKEYERSKNKH